MQHLPNTTKAARRIVNRLQDTPFPGLGAERAMALFDRCPRAASTPLVPLPALAARTGVGQIHVKDERGRMGLGSFKALGAAYVIARDAEAGRSAGRTYITASAGNHGLSVAAGAAAFRARAVVVLSRTVPESFAQRLQAHGATVLWRGATYEESMQAAAKEARDHDWILLSDSSWPGYYHRPGLLMEGYQILMQEVIEEIPEPPTHVFLQAGVGGLAAACAAHIRHAWGDAPRILVVEPEAATALLGSMQEGAPVIADGAVSAMGRLDCKEPSLIALKGLARDASDFIAISEARGEEGRAVLAQTGLPSTPSGAAGLAGLLAASEMPDRFGLGPSSHVLAILSEAADPSEPV